MVDALEFIHSNHVICVKDSLISSFQPVMFLFPTLFQWFDPVLWCIRVVRVDILVLFPGLAKSSLSSSRMMLAVDFCNALYVVEEFPSLFLVENFFFFIMNRF